MKKTVLMLLKCALLAVAFIGCGSAFSNGEWASEVDLKAAYCLPVRKASSKDYEDLMKQIPPSGSASDKKKLASLDEVERFVDTKLSNYLLARMVSMNSKARAQITAANQAGEAAFVIHRNISKSCDEGLKESILDMRVRIDELNKCREESGAKQLRLDACFDLSWLPY